MFYDIAERCLRWDRFERPTAEDIIAYLHEMTAAFPKNIQDVPQDAPLREMKPKYVRVVKLGYNPPHTLAFMELKRMGTPLSASWHKAINLKTREIVIIKELELEFFEVDVEHALALCDNELQIMKSLPRGNPYTLRLIISDFDEDYYVVHEFADTTLRSAIHRQDLNVTATFRRLLEIIHFLHEHDIVHTVVSPRSFWYTKKKMLKIENFKSAAKVSGPYIFTNSSLADPYYLAPEQILESKDGNFKLSKATDIWGLGACLYEMIYLRPAFSNFDNLHERLDCVIDDDCEIEFPEIEDQNLNRLVPLIQACLRRTQEDRPTIDQLIAYFDGESDSI
jgi:serine/threonine protein kinase